MPEVKFAKPQDDFASFEFGKGRSGLLRSPFEEYIQLTHKSEDGFLIALVRIIDHPVDFSVAQIDAFVVQTERLLKEAFPDLPKLKVSEKIK
jgi:hypothetical protein